MTTFVQEHIIVGILLSIAGWKATGHVCINWFVCTIAYTYPVHIACIIGHLEGEAAAALRQVMPVS